MNVGRLRAKIRKLTEEHEEEEIENGELNLVPYLDIVTNVIMFLMMTMTFAAALADINVAAPSRIEGSGSDSPPPVNDLNLTVSISDKGFTIAASGAVLYENDIPGRVPTIPKKADGQYDYGTLTKKMRQIKDFYASQDPTKVIINANPEIIYEILVDTMDAIRNDGTKILFPDVLLAAGVGS